MAEGRCCRRNARRMRVLLVGLLAGLLVCPLTGCNNPSGDEPVGLDGFSGTTDGIYIEVTEGQLAEMMAYRLETGDVYLANVQFLDEFGPANEGNVTLREGVLTFSMIRATGSVTGAVDGPQVIFRVDLASRTVLDTLFEPAPDYEALGLDAFAADSRRVITLEDSRILEIADLFAVILERFGELARELA